MTSADPASPERSADSVVDVNVSTKRVDICPDREALVDVARYVLRGERVPFERIGLVLADHDLVTELNSRYLNHDWHTDVLSFLLTEDPPIEGEVYVDVQTAAERCEEFGSTPADEILRYVVHGLLHLAGHDDATDEERAEMRKLEDHYLSRLKDGF
ncbi:MAG: rRNA maturation RNase YbeY [Rhodothermales bacterium]|nr:rRNA maturation RNase YbeY [Rhodothermales bacterium]